MGDGRSFASASSAACFRHHPSTVRSRPSFMPSPARRGATPSLQSRLDSTLRPSHAGTTRLARIRTTSRALCVHEFAAIADGTGHASPSQFGRHWRLSMPSIRAGPTSCTPTTCEFHARKTPSYATVRRHMQGQGWLRQPKRRDDDRPGARAARYSRAQRESRGWEMSHVHALWHLDFKDGPLPVLTRSGERKHPQLFGVIDNRSRLVCHLQWYLGEGAEELTHGLGQALQKRGK